MRIDLNCPAEVVSTELIREEGDWVRLILMNLTERGIDSCEATVRLLNREGEEKGRTVHRARALRGRPHSAFTMMVPAELPEGTVRAEATLDKVWFEDRDVWRRNPALETEYESNLLPPGNDLNALRYVAGNSAVGFPSQQASLWVCVCGRPNANGDAYCVRCRRQKELIFQQYNRNEVLRQVSQRERQLDLETRGAREETARLQRLREEEYHRKQLCADRRKKLLAALICALAAAALCLWGIEPALRLWSADSAIREGRLEDAKETLTGLRHFPGAEGLLAEAELQTARRDGETAAENPDAFSEEQMAEMAALLRGKGDGAADDQLADRIDLSRAKALLKAGKPEEAETLLRELPETLEGRGGLLNDCTWARAEKALQAHEYETARKLFESLGDYPGAAEKALEAQYESALMLMEAGEYDAAIAAFSGIPDYLDCRELIRRCYYLKGLVLESQGEAEAARAAYLSAESYEDSAERAQAIQWRQAEAFYAAKDYASALVIYREMDGYEDAREKWITCALELARAAYKQKEYAEAAAYLEDLPEDTREIRQIRTRGWYLGAKAAAERGELEEAISMMEKVSTYSDAMRCIRTWRMELARQRMNEGRFDEAKKLLEPVADNYQVKQLIREIEEKEAAAGQAEEKKPEGEN